MPLKSFVIALIVSVSLLISCKKKPSYSSIPEIEFKSLYKYTVYSANKGTMVDSLILSVDFQDGEGDLGVDQEDLLLYPWKDTFNILIDVYRKTGGVYNKLNLVPSYNGNFPLLSPKNTVGPIDGTLNYAIVIAQSPFQPIDDTLKFEIQILDRKLQASNVVTSRYVIVNEQ